VCETERCQGGGSDVRDDRAGGWQQGGDGGDKWKLAGHIVK